MSSEIKRKPPLFLYRGDSRHPDEIFKQGFTARGSDTDVRNHVKGGENLAWSALISTSATLRIPANFIAEVRDSDGNRDMVEWPTDRQWYTRRAGWVYFIKPSEDLEMVHVSDELRRYGLDRGLGYNYEQEWAVVGHIPGKNIQRAMRIDGYTLLNDFDNGWGLYLLSPPGVNVYHEMLPNPDYAYNSGAGPQTTTNVAAAPTTLAAAATKADESQSPPSGWGICFCWKA